MEETMRKRNKKKTLIKTTHEFAYRKETIEWETSEEGFTETNEYEAIVFLKACKQKDKRRSKASIQMTMQ